MKKRILYVMIGVVVVGLLAVAVDYSLVWYESLVISGGAYKSQPLVAGDAVRLDGTSLLVRCPPGCEANAEWYAQVPASTGLLGSKFSWRQVVRVSPKSSGTGPGGFVIVYGDDERWLAQQSKPGTSSVEVVASGLPLHNPLVRYSLQSSGGESHSSLRAFSEEAPGHFVEAYLLVVRDEPVPQEVLVTMMKEMLVPSP